MYDVAKIGNEMQKYMADHKINPFSNVIPIMFQLPIFMSMFFGLRGMANLPVESMCDGGLFWFTDLTMPDPYCILPLLTASMMGSMGRHIIKVIPVIIFFTTWNFPAAVTYYW